MTVAELINRLKKLDPDTLVVGHADMSGYNDCEAVLKVQVIKRRPQSEASNGQGRYVDLATKPKSRANRLGGVVIV